MAHLARHGYPVPAVRPEDAPDRDGLVMQRITGPTMAEALLAGTITPEQAGESLAELLNRLHAVPAPAGADAGHLTLTGGAATSRAPSAARSASTRTSCGPSATATRARQNARWPNTCGWRGHRPEVGSSAQEEEAGSV